MRSVIRFGSQHLYGLDVTAQFVCYDDTWLAITRYEAFQKAFCGLGTTVFQDENVQYIAVRINGVPKPDFLAVDHNDDFIEMPFISTARSFAFDAIREMTA